MTNIESAIKEALKSGRTLEDILNEVTDVANQEEETRKFGKKNELVRNANERFAHAYHALDYTIEDIGNAAIMILNLLHPHLTYDELITISDSITTTAELGAKIAGKTPEEVVNIFLEEVPNIVINNVATAIKREEQEKKQEEKNMGSGKAPVKRIKVSDKDIADMMRDFFSLLK